MTITFIPKIKMPIVKLNDRVVGRVCLLFVLEYLIMYGYYFHKIPVFGTFNWTYFSVLFLIFGIDIIKTCIEPFACGPFYNGNEDLSKVTVIIPTKDGGEVLEQTIVDLLRRFDPKRIIISSNGSTDDTCARAEKYGVIVLDVKEPLGKVGAINYALQFAETPYCLIMDDDTLIKDALIPTSALDDGYDGVAFRVLPIITTWISKLQYYEYMKSMDIGKCFHNKYSTVQNISGAIGLYSVDELSRQIDIHTGEFSGEDLQRTLLIYLKDYYRGVVIANSVVETEVPNTIGALYSQRIYGWFPGLYSNFLNYFKILFSRKANFYLRYDAFYNCVLVLGMDPIRVFCLPIMIFYPWYFVILYVSYVLLELIPYFKLKGTMPFWVVVIYPLYGLFGFLTRILATVVFMYRRISVYIERSEKRDNYRFSKLQTKLIAYLILIILFQATIYTIICYRDMFSWLVI